jgi:hypothetical protein
VGFDLPAEDNARFKLLCRARGITMRREIQAILRAQFAHRGGLLSEDCLCVRVSPEMKRQLTQMARKRRMKVETLVREALARMMADSATLARSLHHDLRRPRL